MTCRSKAVEGGRRCQTLTNPHFSSGDAEQRRAVEGAWPRHVTLVFVRKPGSVDAASAAKLVARFVVPLQGVLDRRVVDALAAAVTAACMGAQLTLTALGRGLPGRALPKHSVKRVDRLLGNRGLHERLHQCWAALASFPPTGPIILLVDWTGANDGRQWWILSAAVAAPGRAIPVYDAVLPKGQYDSFRAREAFLLQLQKILPPGRRVIVVADSGFRVPFLKQLQRRGWDYVVRLRGRPRLLLVRTGEILRPANLHRRAGLGAQALGPVQLREKEPFFVHQLVRFRTRRRGRKAKDRLGRIRRWRRSRHYARSWREPWLLLSSLQESPERIRHLYSMRMAIEETFRDMKNPRLGLGFAGSACRSIQRVRVLWLIGAMAVRACRAAGEHAEAMGLIRTLQANTVRHRRVLSLFHAGRLLLSSLLAPLRSPLGLPP